ncbi:hypothetical protein LOK49_LG03G01722 [Camellia lanceoleosa]|uniref:Uncharacterized protein n=1 Tax=Camellia lanceoleosa TaxID=1840588 RepID=A0ACC0I6N1_9ERIC|nr:hypothetical protein LOK49_LG03G01722 [Camellia lanceoleosa]
MLHPHFEYWLYIRVRPHFSLSLSLENVSRKYPEPVPPYKPIFKEIMEDEEKKIVGIDKLTKRLEKSEWLKFKPFAVATRRREEDGEQDCDQPSNTRIIHNNNNTLKNEFLDYKYGCDQFSFFQTGPTFVTDYERCKGTNLCFLCEKSKMELYNVPCGCRIWCISCGEELSDYVHQCIICNAEVEKLELLSLPSSSSDNRQSIVNEIPVKTQASKQRGKQRREIKMRMKMEEQKDENEDGEGGGAS